MMQGNKLHHRVTMLFCDQYMDGERYRRKGEQLMSRYVIGCVCIFPHLILKQSPVVDLAFDHDKARNISSEHCFVCKVCTY